MNQARIVDLDLADASVSPLVRFMTSRQVIYCATSFLGNPTPSLSLFPSPLFDDTGDLLLQRSVEHIVDRPFFHRPQLPNDGKAVRASFAAQKEQTRRDHGHGR